MKKLVFVTLVFVMLSFYGCSGGGGGDDVTGEIVNGATLKVEVGKDRNILLGIPIHLKAETVESPDADFDLIWDFGDGSTAEGVTVSHSYEYTGQYTVMLTLNTSSGKSAFDTFTLKVIDWDALATPLNAGGHIIQAPLVDFLPDGRMVIADGNSATEIEIAVETAKGSRTFNYVMSIIPETSGSFGSFIKVVDADTILLGASTHIYRINPGTGEHSILAAAANFDAALSGTRLYFAWSSYNPDWSANSRVSSLDINNSGTITEVISDIPGASAGICLDDEGNIYTGNGYSNFGIDPGETGLIKRFALSDSPQTWAEGDAVAKVLSATPLIYAGNDIILTAGGDFFGTGDANYFAAVNASTGEVVLKLDPDSSANSYYKLSAGNGRFAASIWDYTNSVGTLYLLPFDALGL